MQQLDVRADEETLELEVEVERLLREQEAEAGKRVAVGERPCQSAEESVTLEFVKEDKKPQEQSASLEVGEQCGSSSRIPHMSPDCPNQGVNDTSAAVAT